jgi:ribosomal protein S1
VQGTVVRVDQRGAYVDIGGKSTAFCPTAELALANVPRVCTAALLARLYLTLVCCRHLRD